MSFDYLWGDALDTLERLKPDVRLINLETDLPVPKAPYAWFRGHFYPRGPCSKRRLRQRRTML